MAGQASRENGKKGGRKPGLASIIAERTKAYIAERIDAEQGDLVKAQIEKAKTGDTTAFTALYNRAFGTPAQSVEMTGKDGKDLFAPSDKLKELADDLKTIQQRGNSKSK